MNITIDGDKHTIIPVSKLSFRSFNKIFIEAEAFDLKEYISFFVNIPIEDLMQKEVPRDYKKLAFNKIFDIDIESRIKTTPKTFRYKTQTYYVEDMRLATFGQCYAYDLYKQKYDNKEINFYELSVYSIAVFLDRTLDMSKIEIIYKELSLMNWTSILPVSFFLLKNILKGRINLLQRLILFTVVLKRMKLLSSFRRRKSISLARKILPKF